MASQKQKSPETLGISGLDAVYCGFLWTSMERCLAETKGFEPLMRLNTPYSLSRGAPSATRSRFQQKTLYAQIYAAACSNSNALCKARTASSMYFSSITTEVLISEVEII